MQAALDTAEETGLWLFDAPTPQPIDGLAMFEITVRCASLDVSPEQAAEAVARLQTHLARRMAG